MDTPNTSAGPSRYAPAGLPEGAADRIVELLQDRLNAAIDLTLTLKHIHWNVVGPAFIAVHEMLDVQVVAARAFADAIAERIATLGGEPTGTPAYVVKTRTWEDYPIGRAGTQVHLAALDDVYSGVIGDHRGAIEATEELDRVTQDMLIGQTNQLELFQWFVRAHLEDANGNVAHPAS